MPDNFFDLAIGNVPFGQYQVSDRRYDKLHFQIHDYFLAKTVDKLRVGGIMAFITTSGTMDIHNHIMINAVSFYDYKKLRTVPYRTAHQIRDISDRLCMEAHLSVIDDPQKIGQLYPENAGKKKSVSNRTEI